MILYTQEWLALNFQQNFNARTSTVMIYDISKIKIGKNSPTNRLKIINGLIQYDWLNLSLNSYKIKCKQTRIKRILSSIDIKNTSAKQALDLLYTLVKEE